MILEYARVRDTAKPPERANPSDAGLDVFFNPEKSDMITLKPGETISFDAGAVNNTLDAIAYDASSSELLIITIT